MAIPSGRLVSASALSRGLRRPLLVMPVVLVAGCGGSGSSGSPLTHTSGASPGELLSYTLDTAGFSDSYRVTHSNYGLAGPSGPGTLTASPDGTDTPRGMPNARIYIAPNGMLIGGLRLKVDGDRKVVPLVGFPHALSSLSGIAGDYNFVQGACNSSSRATCGTGYGTFDITTGGDWTSCNRADHPTSTSCNGNTRHTGSLNSLGNGEWQILDSAGSEIGTGIGFRAPTDRRCGSSTSRIRPAAAAGASACGSAPARPASAPAMPGASGCPRGWAVSACWTSTAARPALQRAVRRLRHAHLPAHAEPALEGIRAVLERRRGAARGHRCVRGGALRGRPRDRIAPTGSRIRPTTGTAFRPECRKFPRTRSRIGVVAPAESRNNTTAGSR